jgi:CYTH domain-containing protein
VSTGQEIERKFLVEGELPPGVQDGACELINQGYIAIDPTGAEVRLRAKGGQHTLGIKSGPARTRVEQEIDVDAGCFETLWPLTDGRRIEKHRYRIATDSAAEIELDIYEGELAGLVVAEVEFPSEREADEFEPPAWLGREVTGDARYSNQSLAERGRAQRQVVLRMPPSTT